MHFPGVQVGVKGQIVRETCIQVCFLREERAFSRVYIFRRVTGGILALFQRK